MRRLVGGSKSTRRPFAAAVVALLVLVGCGSSKADDAGAPQSTNEAAADAATTTSTTATAKPGSSKPKGQSATTTTPAAAAAPLSQAEQAKLKVEDDDPTNTLDISAGLKESCVRPGGSQTITIRARTASGVGYDSVYSDGKSGMMEGFYGGNNAGYADDKNTYTDTWVIAPQAPAGPVLVRVLGTHEVDGFGQTEVHFKVADALGKCS